jgi:membrane protease YdiL (CAAX protease family)
MNISAPVQNAIAILVIAFGILFMHFGGLPMFVAPAIVLLAVWLFLKFISKENFSALLFSFKRFEFKAVWMGAVAAIALSLFLQFLWHPLMEKILPGQKINLSAFDFIRGNFFNYIFILLMAVLVGGFFEEIFFHGFVFTRFEKIFTGRYTVIISVILSNIIFGLYHYQMGIKEIFLATIAGLAYHYLIIKFNRNLWYGLFFHTFFDFIGLTQIYLGYI